MCRQVTRGSRLNPKVGCADVKVGETRGAISHRTGQWLEVGQWVWQGSSASTWYMSALGEGGAHRHFHFSETLLCSRWKPKQVPGWGLELETTQVAP